MLSRRDMLAAAVMPLLPQATQIMDWDAEDRLGRDAMKCMAKYGVKAVVLPDDIFEEQDAWKDKPFGIRLIKESVLQEAESALLGRNEIPVR